jgi:hypothetical protein
MKSLGNSAVNILEVAAFLRRVESQVSKALLENLTNYAFESNLKFYFNN